MTDEFNLVPGTNEEKLLDNILRTAQGEQPQYNLVPNWRIEQYLDAIQKALSGGGGLPPVTESDNGKVLTVENGAWDTRYVRDIYQQQTITIVVGEDYSLSVDPSSQTSLNYYEQNRITYINLVDSNGSTLASLVAQPAMMKLVGGGFACDYVTPIVPLDALGITGYVGFFYTYEYSEGTYAYLYKWQATQGIA